MTIQKVAVVGGTHGNEYTGVALLRLLEQRNTLDAYRSLDIRLLLSNPKAYQQNVRFVDFDLNRSFLTADLQNPALSSYEANRAKVIQQLLNPEGQEGTDLIIDIHTTTSNMGLTVILFESNAFNLQLAAHLQSTLPNVYVYCVSPDSYSGLQEHAFLNSLAPFGFALEIGPIPNGVVRHDILIQACNAVTASLAFAERFNAGNAATEKAELEVYEHVKLVEFPVDEQGNIDAVVHRSIQDKDFQPLKPGTPLFERFNGEVILSQETDTLYPLFINEAAYYYKKVAMSLTRKRRVSVVDNPA